MKNAAEFDKQLRRSIAIQAVRAAYGGPVPYWVENGLAVMHLFTLLKGCTEEKPNPVGLKDAKAAVAKRAETLAYFLDEVNPPPAGDEAEITRVMWAWHYYLRAAPAAADEKARYEKYMDTLANAGDAEAARAVWEGADFAASRAAMIRWMQAR